MAQLLARSELGAEAERWNSPGELISVQRTRRHYR